MRKFSPVIDFIASPFVYIAANFLKLTRKLGLYKRFPITRKILLHVGIYPLIDHYYEPIFDTRHLRHSLRDDRKLPGVDMNDAKQIELLNSFHYQEELLTFPLDRPKDFDSKAEYYYLNGNYEMGDGEFLYNMVRKFKPSHIIEIGSGFSTLMIIKNHEEDNKYSCLQECIEPYEMPWLETKPVHVIRQKLEEVDQSLFAGLKANDMLIIDSSHIIRPQGDVLTEYLEILPALAPGVIVHVHDIFTPKDYPEL